jgi:hypothetical protein
VLGLFCQCYVSDSEFKIRDEILGHVSAMAKALTALFATLTREHVQLLLVQFLNATKQVNLPDAAHAAFAGAGNAVGGVAKSVKGAAKAGATDDGIISLQFL